MGASNVTRSELAALIASTMHRTDLSALILTWIDMASSRIGRDLRSTELEGIALVAMSSGVGALPPACREIRAVTNGTTTLVSMGVDTLPALQQGNGAPPLWYALAGLNIVCAPLFTGDLQLLYFANPNPLTDDASTNAILEQYPYLYLYAALIEGFFYTQDGDLMKAAEQRYFSEIALINKSSAELRAGSAKAMRSMRR